MIDLDKMQCSHCEKYFDESQLEKYGFGDESKYYCSECEDVLLGEDST